MTEDLIIKTDGKETFRLSSGFALGTKVPETKLDIKMTDEQLTHEEMLEIAAEREAANKPTRNERIDLAVKELGYMLMGGQDMREYASSVAFIMDVLESLKDKEDTEWKDSADGVA